MFNCFLSLGLTVIMVFSQQAKLSKEGLICIKRDVQCILSHCDQMVHLLRGYSAHPGPPPFGDVGGL